MSEASNWSPRSAAGSEARTIATASALAAEADILRRLTSAAWAAASAITCRRTLSAWTWLTSMARPPITAIVKNTKRPNSVSAPVASFASRKQRS